MVTSGTGGKRSGSSSAIFAATVSGYHILRIHGYAGTKATPTGEYLKSHPFTVGGHRWAIRYYPNGESSKSSDHISFFLALDESVTKAVKAQYQIRFVDKEEVRPLTSEPVDSFNNQSTSPCYSKFIKREEFEKSEHLRDDSFAVRCDIAVIGDVRVEATASGGSIAVPASDLHQHLGDLLRAEQGADVVFDVGGRTFAAHRCVLAARSPVFRAELFGSMKESNAASGVVRVDDMEVQAFKGLLHFVYTDTFPETPKEGEEEEEEDVMAQHLLVAADRYGMERLKLMCEDKLCKYIGVGTVAAILTLAERHHCQGLKKACFEFLSSAFNLKAVAASDGFKHLASTCPSIMEEFVVMLGNLVP